MKADIKHQTLTMGTEMVSETSEIFNEMTQLIARKDFTNFSRLEGFRSYVIKAALL
jgi:hypothetical protein